MSWNITVAFLESCLSMSEANEYLTGVNLMEGLPAQLAYNEICTKIRHSIIIYNSGSSYSLQSLYYLDHIRARQHHNILGLVSP